MALLLSSLTIAGCGSQPDSDRLRQQIKADTIPRWIVTDFQGKAYQAKRCDFYQGSATCVLMDNRQIVFIGNTAVIESEEWKQ